MCGTPKSQEMSKTKFCSLKFFAGEEVIDLHSQVEYEDRSRWRHNKNSRYFTYFLERLIQFTQTIPFFASSNCALINVVVYLSLFRHPKCHLTNPKYHHVEKSDLDHLTYHTLPKKVTSIYKHVSDLRQKLGQKSPTDWQRGFMKIIPISRKSKKVLVTMIPISRKTSGKKRPIWAAHPVSHHRGVPPLPNM